MSRIKGGVKKGEMSKDSDTLQSREIVEVQMLMKEILKRIETLEQMLFIIVVAVAVAAVFALVGYL